MGMLIDGQWKDFDRTAGDGNYHRKPSSFRDRIGPEGRFPAEPGRYHLYVSLACPWASRVVIVRALKHLQALIGMSVVSPDMLENGWPLDPAPDQLTGADYIYQIYAAADPAYTGTATVPILYDKVARTIVNNESSDLVRNLNHAFDALAAPSPDLYPAALGSQIDALNDRIYGTVNNGVYKAGFATTQEAYEKAVIPLFDMLDELDARLAGSRFLFGDAHRDRHPPVHHRHPLRHRLFQPLQVQPPPMARLPESVPLARRGPRYARHCGDRRSGPDQAALLLQPALGKPDRHRARRTDGRFDRATVLSSLPRHARPEGWDVWGVRFGILKRAP